MISAVMLSNEMRFLMRKYLSEQERIERMEVKLQDNIQFFVSELAQGKRITLTPGRSSFRVFVCTEREVDINGKYRDGIGGGSDV